MRFQFNLGAISCTEREHNMRFQFNSGAISCNDDTRRFEMDESSISLEMDPSELIELYKLDRDLIPSIVSLIKEINNPSKSSEDFKEDIADLKKSSK